MKNLLANLNVLDYGICILIGLGLMVGVKKGLSDMVTRTVALLGLTLAVFYYYLPIASQISTVSFLPRRSAEAIVFVLSALAGWVVINFALKLLSKIAEIKFSEQANRLGGFLLGGVWMYFFLGWVLYSLIMFKAPFLDTQLTSDSFFAPTAIRLPLVLYQFIFHELPPQPSV